VVGLSEILASATVIYRKICGPRWGQRIVQNIW